MSRQPVRLALAPVLLAAPVVLVVALVGAGVDLSVAALAVIIGHIAVVAAAERVWPRVEGVDLFADRQAARDALHGLLTSLVGSPIGSVIVTVGLVAAFGDADGVLARWWPVHLPLSAQVLAAWFIYGFGDYWKHRAYHSIDALWWVHAVHHDAPQMHVLKGSRLHLLEGTVRAAVVMLPLLLLGVPGEVLIWATTIDSLLGNLNHSNLDQRFPRFVHRLVPTVDLHHIHHAVDRSLHDTNLGIPLFDLAFGTYTDPRIAPRPRVGLADSPVPWTLAGQLLFPLHQWRTAMRPATADS